MKINRHIHQTLRLKSLLITLALLAMIVVAGWLGQRYPLRIDLSANAANTLAEASVKVLDKLSAPIQVKAYIREAALRQQIEQLLARYQRHKTDVSVEFIDPNTVPEQAREHHIGPQGAVIVEYQGRSEQITYLDETSMTNALLRLAVNQERWITFLSGHGEPSPQGQANFDLSLFAGELNKRGIHAQQINLAQLSAIPDNSSLLVLTSPEVELLPGELNLIDDYLSNGGNLLLLTEPGKHFLEAIEQQLNITKLPGKIVDARANLYGIDDPTFVLAGDYGAHPITQNFNNLSVFPLCAALDFSAEDSEYEGEALLNSIPESWNETGPISGKIRFDADGEEREGPLDFAYALTRQLATDKQQRIVVIGDGDFLSNAYLHNVGNLELGLRTINWLTENDSFIDIPGKTAPGKTLQLSTVAVAIIGFGFLFFIPGLLFLTGLIIWRKRRKR